MKNKMNKMRGFTLVELLIVIALIAILSVAVLATINPIEQSNKARDASFKNDAAEVLNAFERYYTSSSRYPWMDVRGIGVSSVSDTIVVGSTSPAFGVVGVGDTPGLLISTSELKNSFAGKDPFQASAAEEDKMYVVHNGDTNDNYVCFHPKAAANRSQTNLLKCLSLGDEVLYNYGGNSGTCTTPTSWGSDDLAPSATAANLMCVPEGEI